MTIGSTFNIYDIYLSKPFSRMRNKTQLFSSLIDDHYHTRLLHSLEVEIISKKIATKLLCNEIVDLGSIDFSLLSSIALLHDVGHTPYGHVGERALNDICCGNTKLDGISDFNELGVTCGFKHNINSAVILRKYFSKSKIKLDEEFKEKLIDGIIKHSKLRYKNDFDCGSSYVTEWLKDRNGIIMKDYLFKTIEGGIVYYADELAQVGSDLLDLKNSKIEAADSLRSVISSAPQSRDDKNDSVFLVDELIDKLVSGLIITKLDNNFYTLSCPYIDNLLKDFDKVRFDIIRGTEKIANHDSSKILIINELFKYFFLHPEKANKNLLRDYYYRLKEIDFEYFVGKKDDKQSTKWVIDRIDPDSETFFTKFLQFLNTVKTVVENGGINQMRKRKRSDYKLMYKYFIISVAIYISEMTDNYANNIYNDIIMEAQI